MAGYKQAAREIIPGIFMFGQLELKPDRPKKGDAEQKISVWGKISSHFSIKKVYIVKNL